MSSRPQVLDSGEDGLAFVKSNGKVSLTTGVTIAYTTYSLSGNKSATDGAVDVQAGAGTEAPAPSSSTSTTDKVVMIMGFAAEGAAWLPMISNLFKRGQKAANIEVLTLDNRGIGGSTIPEKKTAYSTDIMAQDVLGVMDHLGWRKAHVIGHSMGGMISCRLALAAPERVASLTLVSVTAGHFEAFPFNTRALRAAMRGRRKKDLVTRAEVDLTFHFKPQLLKQKDPVTGRLVGDILRDEYVKTKEDHGSQPQAGQDGHAYAVYKNKLSSKDLRKLAHAGFPIKVIHGDGDIVAAPRYAARIARKLGAPFIVFDSGHFTPRDRATEVTDELLGTIEAVRQGATHVDAVHKPADPAAYSGCLACCA